ncbi:hypothetical protein [Streptomyces sp. B3I8]|uniref:hypothetical protein n=1 Tax=Streptomyces sp. B3I8 TaxID=3042303 RepID=UPI002785D18E|nr:hypothetical protein [Streptomyces sp. B3I8]MDQ0784601.1 hypothetical protein [Streptomyces sp. B3I8]
MSTRDFNGAYLLPLFGEVEQARTDGAYRQLPAPDSASSLATDDAPLGAYAAAHLIRASYTAGLAHADALRRLTVAGEIDPTSPGPCCAAPWRTSPPACGSWTARAGPNDGAARCRCGTRTCATVTSTNRTPATPPPATA